MAGITGLPGQRPCFIFPITPIRPRMKKKRAILLFASLFVLMLAYAAWCGRSMYLSVPAPDLSHLPPEYREDAKAVIIERGLTRPDPFKLAIFIRLLAKPYDSNPFPVEVDSRALPSHLMIWRPRRVRQPHEVAVMLFPEHGGWHVSGYDLDSGYRPGRRLIGK
jgi:hypothetical protein